MKKPFEFVILKMWYWNWGEDNSISAVVLLNKDDKLDDCVREVVTSFALTHNHSRPKDKVMDVNVLTDMMANDINNLKLSEQIPCQFTNHTLMNVLSYTNTKNDGHIEVMGVHTNPYELSDRY